MNTLYQYSQVVETARQAKYWWTHICINHGKASQNSICQEEWHDWLSDWQFVNPDRLFQYELHAACSEKVPCLIIDMGRMTFKQIVPGSPCNYPVTVYSCTKCITWNARRGAGECAVEKVDDLPWNTSFSSLFGTPFLLSFEVIPIPCSFCRLSIWEKMLLNVEKDRTHMIKSPTLSWFGLTCSSRPTSIFDQGIMFQQERWLSAPGFN